MFILLRRSGFTFLLTSYTILRPGQLRLSSLLAERLISHTHSGHIAHRHLLSCFYSFWQQLYVLLS